ncbi:unnamed protein product [Ectocarpus sp. 12 AP-2014]
MAQLWHVVAVTKSSGSPVHRGATHNSKVLLERTGRHDFVAVEGAELTAILGVATLLHEIRTGSISPHLLYASFLSASISELGLGLIIALMLNPNPNLMR